MHKGPELLAPVEQDTEIQGPPVISSRVSNTWSCSGVRGAMPEAGFLEGSGGMSRAGGWRAEGLNAPISTLTEAFT